ncbi:hypothetical protein EV424DRAFT_1543985 [Suillus variegatus]|nr:hypothetical protein EV424DRAFT_1543985 [Suillus variegatus]
MTPIGNVVFHPPTTPIADIPAPDDSVTEPESEVEPGTPGVAADKTVVNTSAGIKRPGSRQQDILPTNATEKAEFKRAGERFVPNAAQDTGLVLRGYSVPLHEPQPLLSPDAQFQDPRCILESPVEQEMLDYGLLTGEDLDLMTHGIALPKLRLNFHSPEALLDAVDHFGAYNAANQFRLTSTHLI